MTTNKARDFMAFPKSNIRARCNGKRVAGLKLFYQSTTEYFGVDRVQLLVISVSGGEREATYVIRPSNPVDVRGGVSRPAAPVPRCCGTEARASVWRPS